MHRMGFSYVKPRTVPRKSASKMEQEEFMKQCKQLVSEKSAEDYTMLAQDEAGVRLGACGRVRLGGSKPTGARSASDFPPRRQELSERSVLTQST